MAEDVKYKKISVLGRGGFGTVWLADDLRTGEQVALKIMNVPTPDQDGLKMFERFLREIDITKILQHPHILRAIDSGYTLSEGYSVPYLVSPYMPDGSLHAFTRDMPPWQHWTLAQTADVILQAAQALHYLHTREPGICHQDVKPANFLVRREAGPERIVHLYLCDFGISRWQGSLFDRTSLAAGTFGYIAPEQLDGNISWTADQYALAVMAYHFLTGSMPESKALVPPSLIPPGRGLTGEVDRVLLKALQTEPDRRYPSILVFAEELQATLLALPAQKTYEAQTQAGALLSTAAPPPPPAVSDEQLPPIPIDPLTKSSLIRPVKKVAPSPPPPPGLGKQPLQQPTLRQVLRKELPAFPRMLSWSKDGEFLVCTFHAEVPVLVSRQGSAKIMRLAEPARAACWSPDSRTVAFNTQSSQGGKIQSSVVLWRLDAPTEGPLTLLSKDQPIESLDWSSQGQLAIWIEKRIEIYALPKRLSPSIQPMLPLTLSVPDMYCGSADALHWSPDGSLLAAGTRDGVVRCWRAYTSKSIWQKSVPNQLVFSIAWSPDSAMLSVAFSNRQVTTFAASTGEILSEWKDLSSVPLSVSVSSEQDLAIASDDDALLLGHPSEPAPSAVHPGYRFAAWSPARQELATLAADNERILLVWAKEDPCRELRASFVNGASDSTSGKYAST